MFKAGRGARLSPADLKRFGRRFEADLEALMPGRTCRLKPLTDKPLPETWLDSECHVLPLNFRDRPLGYLHISPGVVGDDEDFLAELVRQGLEGIWLRKALMTDRETGLFSREYFGGRLLRFLRKHRRPGLAMSLSLDEEAAPELLLVLAELREAAAPPRSLLNFVRRLSQNLLLRCPTRSGPQQLAFLLEGDPDDIRLNLENALDDQVAAEPDSRPVAAWVRWPRDLGRDPGEAGPAQVRAQASELWEKAETALFFARQNRGGGRGRGL
ncbi:hypothetical protein LJB99_04365 [Deltaproteobacteria bacterium OttesenSCG-928-K17]|nr:hypothetical protein [Deltaproteobacteria bacterium OttesenSCG-928-K17]